MNGRELELRYAEDRSEGGGGGGRGQRSPFGGRGGGRGGRGGRGLLPNIVYCDILN